MIPWVEGESNLVVDCSADRIWIENQSTVTNRNLVNGLSQSPEWKREHSGELESIHDDYNMIGFGFDADEHSGRQW